MKAWDYTIDILVIGCGGGGIKDALIDSDMGTKKGKSSSKRSKICPGRLFFS